MALSVHFTHIYQILVKFWRRGWVAAFNKESNDKNLLSGNHQESKKDLIIDGDTVSPICEEDATKGLSSWGNGGHFADRGDPGPRDKGNKRSSQTKDSESVFKLWEQQMQRPCGRKCVV